MRAANRRTVVVLQSPGPVLMPWARRVPSILEAWLPGQEGGTAIAGVLFGDVNPSGKLPVTYPRRLRDVPARSPSSYPGVGGTVFHREGLRVGYRHYDKRGLRPLFAFGHGLSYTRFRYRRLALRRSGGRVRVGLTLTNVGRRWARKSCRPTWGCRAGARRAATRPGPSRRLRA